MGYHVVDPADVEPTPDRPSTMYSISDVAELENLGLRYYDVAPGEDMPLALHYHEEQEEAFFVVSGELHVETPDQEYVVEQGQFFTVKPENPHRAFTDADADENATVVAIGAPAVDDAQPYEE